MVDKLKESLSVAEEHCPLSFGELNHPSVMADLLNSLPPYDWQMAIWDAVFRPGSQVAARTCNGSGKTSLVVPMLAVTWAASFPGSQCVITSASDDQIKLQLWPAIRSLVSNLSGWTTTADRIYAPSINGIERSVIAIRVTKTGERFEGFHERWYPDNNGKQHFSPLLIIGDEAKSIKHDIWVAMERCDPTSQLMISTTGEDNGDFYDACMNKSGLWTTSWNYSGKEYDFKIPWTDCPHLMHGHSRTRKQAMLDDLGSNHPTTASILLADFFRGGTHMVFGSHDMIEVKGAMAGLRDHIRGTRTAFCDFSGGGDELTFGVRDGNKVYDIEAWRHDTTTSPVDTSRKYISLFERWGLRPHQISGDNGGVGAQIINQLSADGWPIRRVNNDASARYKEGFSNCYTESHWDLKENLHGMILPKDPVLLEQMRLRRYTQKNSDNSCIRLEQKGKARTQRNESSPDRLDTVVGLCLNMEKIEKGGVRSKVTACGTPAEYSDWVKKMDENKQDNWQDGW